ncbi:hypothetical protein JOC34_003476 [Virgibacillus halotolerans]|nr:hypothetical protein [Virgibacillus halotolerans]
MIKKVLINDQVHSRNLIKLVMGRVGDSFPLSIVEDHKRILFHKNN